MQKLEFSTDINASKEKVWSILWNDKTFRDWANNIDPGMYLVGKLEEGAEVQFLSQGAEYGVTSLVEKLILNEFVSFRHLADTVEGGTREREKEWTGGQESYALAEHDGITTLTIASDTPSEQLENFKSILPKALARIKELSENDAHKRLYLYHWVPKDMQGDVLYPLNVLKETHPELYKDKSGKYEGREHVMDWHIPVLNCRWNDVIHLTAVHPRIVEEAMAEAGETEKYETRCYQIDPRTLDPKNAIVYMYIHEPVNGEFYPEDFVSFDPADLERHAVIPQFTKDYYKKCFSEGKTPLALPWVPHIFYKGSINIKDVPIVTSLQ